MSGGLYSSPQVNSYPQSEFLDKSTNRPTRAWQQFFLNLVNFTSASSATT